MKKAAVFYDTPEQSVFDNMGRAFLVVQMNAQENNSAIEYSFLNTSSEMDIQSNVITVTDPRGVLSLTQSFSMSGDMLSSKSADAGLRLDLKNADGNSIHGWDSRGFHTATSYDKLQRPLAIHVDGDDGNGLMLGQVVESIIYGESQPDADERNLRGHVYEWSDQAGVVHYGQYGIGGQLLKSWRQLRADYKNEANWNSPEAVELEPERYETGYSYNALGNLISEVTPDGSEYRAQYTISGLLKRIDVFFANGQSQVFVNSIEYDAAGQRERVGYGNEVVTKFNYEPTTLRLSNILTTRPPANRKGQSGSTTLQNIAYTYDAVGNLTTINDSSQETVFCDQQRVAARSGYTYDAVYRLIEATGRQHPGIDVDTHVYGFKQTLYLPLCPPHPNDAEKLQNYKETYAYDDAGNLTRLRHIAPPSSPSWTRTLIVPADSNRGVPSDSPATNYDANGNMLALENLRSLSWNYRNNISRVDVILREEGDSDSDYFIYDYAGNRVRKVLERLAYGGTITEIQETIYIGNLVIYRTKKQSTAGTSSTLERQSLHVMDGETCVAITNYWPQDEFKRETDTPGTRRFRFQLRNNLGSSCVEIDLSANVISYEEYFPYGGTSIIAGDNTTEVGLKTYRYSGKECDDSTGLYYYGARYYASWLGRWMSADPAGSVDGLNLYQFNFCNPLVYVDGTGEVGSSTNPISARTKTIPIFTLDKNKSEVAQLYRYLDQPEIEYYAELSDRMSQAIHLDPKLTDKTAPTRFPSDIEAEVWNTLERHRGIHMGSVTGLKEGWETIVENYTGSKTGKELYPAIRSPGFSDVLNANPVIDFSDPKWERPPEVHHLIYKSIRPEYAVESWNLVLASRGNSQVTGQHEGIFHTLGAAKQGNIYQNLVPATEQLILSWAGQTKSFYTAPPKRANTYFPTDVVQNWSSTLNYSFTTGIWGRKTTSKSKKATGGKARGSIKTMSKKVVSKGKKKRG